ncbi:unnamed protein product [Anisakis simplex]|uniref:BPTI/Kunitz inhibitor domain-containing protein n=1 Tax=Anisakis simplex TaxID=6269 RepID=A0A0M3K7D7_ANISI|nr:unnamed protein product [Anisakis simplex]
MAADQGACAVRTRRYFYDSSTNRCTEFEYGGCEGNLNNFDTRLKCEQFCIDGYDLDTSSAFLSGTEPMQAYQIGLTLSGPLLRHENRPGINE